MCCRRNTQPATTHPHLARSEAAADAMRARFDVAGVGRAHSETAGSGRSSCLSKRAATATIQKQGPRQAIDPDQSFMEAQIHGGSEPDGRDLSHLAQPTHSAGRRPRSRGGPCSWRSRASGHAGRTACAATLYRSYCCACRCLGRRMRSDRMLTGLEPLFQRTFRAVGISLQ